MRIGKWCFLLFIFLSTINNPAGALEQQPDGHLDEASCHGENDSCNAGTDENLLENVPLLGQSLDCTLYMAPSTISNAGLGVFTAIPLVPGDLVGGDLVISLQEILNHPRSALTKLDNPFENYSWNLRTVLLNLGVTSLEEQHTNAPFSSSAAFVPGLESLINSNIILINVAQAESPESHVVDLSTMIRGSTPYRNLTTVVTHPIPAGGELFTYYGDNWFSERAAAMFQEIPLSTDVPIAEELLQDIIQSSAATLIDNDFDLHQRWIQLLNPFPNIQRRRLQQLLPSTIGDLQVALDSGLRAMHQQYAVRTSTELQESGACLNYMTPMPSTLPDGGMGAFATTSLSRGSIITTSPLLAFPNYQASLDHQVWNPHTKMYDTKNTHHRRSLPLVVNYCWGHVLSTLLLCPYGVAVAYVNHAPTKSHVNVRIRWSNRTTFPYLTQEWLEADPLSWNHSEISRFAGFFDFLATRDIQAGEEFFLDYGNEWEFAWRQFLLSPHNDNHSNEGETARRLNELQDELRTEEEQDLHPYAAGVSLRCHESIFESQQLSTVTTKLWSSDKPVMLGLPCQVLERQIHQDTKQTSYAVRVVRPGSPDQIQWVGRAGIPRAYLWFVDESDDFAYGHYHQPVLSASFRHEIKLPNDMIPDAWKNLKKRDESHGRHLPI